MTTYAQVRAGIVLAHFTTDRPKADFADIAHELIEAPANVQDGMLYDGQSFGLPVVPVPETVTMRQARLALLGAGLYAAVDAAINGLPSPQKEAARIEWEYSQEVHRNKALVQALAPALGLSGAQLDALFVAAAAIP
jgi:hypothetical protein